MVPLHSDRHCGHQSEGECVGAYGMERDAGAVRSFRSELYKRSPVPAKGPLAPWSQAGVLLPQAEG